MKIASPFKNYSAVRVQMTHLIDSQIGSGRSKFCPSKSSDKLLYPTTFLISLGIPENQDFNQAFNLKWPKG